MCLMGIGSPHKVYLGSAIAIYSTVKSVHVLQGFNSKSESVL